MGQSPLCLGIIDGGGLMPYIPARDGQIALSRVPKGTVANVVDVEANLRDEHRGIIRSGGYDLRFLTVDAVPREPLRVESLNVERSTGSCPGARPR